MPESGIPDAVRHFLTAHIHSIEQLEVLVLLRATPDREWSAPEVSRELGSSVTSIQDRLGDLASRGFLATGGADTGISYRYAPATADIGGLVDGLALAYKERRLTVVSLIYSKPESDAASFSDAFVIARRKEE